MQINLRMKRFFRICVFVGWFRTDPEEFVEKELRKSDFQFFPVLIFSVPARNLLGIFWQFPDFSVVGRQEQELKINQK